MKKFREKIPVANVNLGPEEARAVADVMASQWLSMGPRVKQFEEIFAQTVGAPYAVAHNNGTSALHVALAALDIQPGDEVIVPSLTFISTANVVLYQHAVPVLAECDPKTYNATYETIKAKITSKTKAIIVVDMNGMPVDYDSFREFEKSGIPVIADSAESLGASYRGTPIGTQCHTHIFSFFPNKNITTGEGGMLVTRDKAFAEKCAKLRHQGQEYRYHHTYLGYNYRMTELQAAIGIEQLKKLTTLVSEKTRLAERYHAKLKNVPRLTTPFVPDYVTQHAWYMYAISCETESQRNQWVRQLEDFNIETRLSFPPIHIQPYYTQRYGYTAQSLPATYDAWSRLINIPLWFGMGEERQDYVIAALRELASHS